MSETPNAEIESLRQTAMVEVLKAISRAASNDRGDRSRDLADAYVMLHSRKPGSVRAIV